jgi:hypothetical protein
MTRRALGLVALLSSLASIDAAGAVRPSKWSPPRCPTAHALVAYYVSDGFTFNNDLIIRRDRHASLCWGRRLPNRSGRVNFLVSRPTTTALTLQLGRIGRLGPPPPPSQGADVPSALLAYRGTTIPDEGYPKTQAGLRALRRAETILDRIIARRAPR